MKEYEGIIDVAETGAVRLGKQVICDGFLRRCSVRVQTHIHIDHMGDFEKSVNDLEQNILMSPATRELLINERNAAYPYRDDILPIEANQPYDKDGLKIILKPSNHILGAVQTAVRWLDGSWVGYSGDFGWPIGDPIKVDVLVVDSNSGSPKKVRQYTQDECEERFANLVIDRIKHGPVQLRSFHKGTMQRALQVLDIALPDDIPFFGSSRLAKENKVYAQFGYPIKEIQEFDKSENRCIILFGPGDKQPVDNRPNETVIVLSAFMTRPDNPILERYEGNYSVGLSNHADFKETLEYIKATGAQYVITDNTRGHGLDLALEVTSRLGISARASSNFSIPRE